jgi:RNA polymerase sigma-70 factor (ECF subfamily)
MVRAGAHAMDVGEMYRRYRGLVYRRIRRFYSGDEAEEVLQEVFVRVLSTPSGFQGDSSPSTWLYQLTTRHCLNRLRDAKRRKELLDTFGEPTWSVGRASPDTEARVFLEELWATLDPELAEIGTYYFVDGMPHHEIARVLGVSRRTVGNRLATLQQIASRAADRTGEVPR